MSVIQKHHPKIKSALDKGHCGINCSSEQECQDLFNEIVRFYGGKPAKFNAYLSYAFKYPLKKAKRHIDGGPATKHAIIVIRPTHWLKPDRSVSPPKPVDCYMLSFLNEGSGAGRKDFYWKCHAE